MYEDDGKSAIEYCLSLGATYADLRIESKKSEELLLDDGKVERSTCTLDRILGIRVLFDGVWGFYAIENPRREDYRAAGEKAWRLAKSYSSFAKEKVKLADAKVYNDKVSFEVKIRPEDNMDMLQEIARNCYSMMKDNVSKSSINIGYQNVKRLFMSSEGANIMQEYTDTTVVLTAIASREGLNESTSATEGGRGGVEMLLNVDEKARYIASIASRLIEAKPIKERKSKVILNPDFVALLTHEILGHPSEADRVLGYELAWAGGAWWAGKLGSRIGSDKLSVIDDPTIPKTLGNYRYDDEGIRAREKVLIKDGILVDHMYSRETAPRFDREPNASMRATDPRFMPLIRMACTYIKPGEYPYQEMIREVDDGYLVCDMKVPSIDMFRYNWSISAQYAYKIERGELKDLHRDVIVMNNAPDFFNSIDACSREFEIRAILNCGKGDPMQIMRMGNGGPYVRGEAIIKSLE